MVEVGDHQPVVVLLAEDLPELGGDADAALSVYDVIKPASEHLFTPPLPDSYTTSYHFIPLSNQNTSKNHDLSSKILYLIQFYSRPLQPPICMVTRVMNPHILGRLSYHSQKQSDPVSSEGIPSERIALLDDE
jgi:hypothetical protein